MIYSSLEAAELVDLCTKSVANLKKKDSRTKMFYKFIKL